MVEMIEGEAAIRCLKFDGQDVEIVCPFCHFNYSHVRSVGTLKGSDEHEAGVYEGTRQTGTTGFRRSAVEVVYECEAGCDGCGFALILQQHKGRNFLRFEKRTFPPRARAELPDHLKAFVLKESTNGSV